MNKIMESRKTITILKILKFPASKFWSYESFKYNSCFKKDFTL